MTRKLPYAGMTGERGKFVKLVHDLVREGGRNHREVFADFLELAFCAIAKPTHWDPKRQDELEARYMFVVRSRDAEYIRRMPELLGMMTIGLQEEPCDFLGSVAGELGALSDHLGQFFTPFELSIAMAEMALSDCDELIREKGFITVSEPACGAGGMVLAAAQVLRSKGLDPELTMYVQAVDLSKTAFQMAYIQLAVSNIAADVCHGNTLTLETFGWEMTPSAFTFADHVGHQRWCECRMAGGHGIAKAIEAGVAQVVRESIEAEGRPPKKLGKHKQQDTQIAMSFDDSELGAG